LTDPEQLATCVIPIEVRSAILRDRRGATQRSGDDSVMNRFAVRIGDGKVQAIAVVIK
jgi:hypothetical protein